MASGVTVGDSVKELVPLMRVVGAKDKTKDRVKLAILTIKDMKQVEVTKKYKPDDFGDLSIFDTICKEMEDQKCFYALYDCNFHTTESGEKDELVFLTWTSDAGSIKNKMIYASSKECLKGCMKGIKHNMEVHERDEWTRKAIANKIEDTSSCTVTMIENVPV